MIRDMNGSVGLSREYGNVSHDTLPYFVVACLRPVGEQGGYWDLPGRVGKTYRGCCGKERPGSLVGKLAEVPVYPTRFAVFAKNFLSCNKFRRIRKGRGLFLNAEIIDLKASINYIITCKACPKLVSGLNH